MALFSVSVGSADRQRKMLFEMVMGSKETDEIENIKGRKSQ